VARLISIIVLMTIASALGVVSAQHRSRRLVTEIDREQTRTRALQEEFTRLDIEFQAVAALPTVEKLARGPLRMDVPGKDALISLDSAREVRR
jgi:cell division protein FtsL